jgi:hypothetical protein
MSPMQAPLPSADDAAVAASGTSRGVDVGITEALADQTSERCEGQDGVRPTWVEEEAIMTNVQVVCRSHDGTDDCYWAN